MEYIRRLPLSVMALMAILSFTNLFGLNISSASIFLGVAFFFINKALEKQPMTNTGLDITMIGTDLRNRKIWIWLMLPIIVDAINISISKLFLPEYIEYETIRAGAFVPVEVSVSSILLFFVFALGEEIAWRAFFQNQLSKAVSLVPALTISSLLFTLGHFAQGNPAIVAFGLFFTFVNGVLYGIIFHKTKNAWVSAISHFAANMFEVIVYTLI